MGSRQKIQLAEDATRHLHFNVFSLNYKYFSVYYLVVTFFRRPSSLRHREWEIFVPVQQAAKCLLPSSFRHFVFTMRELHSFEFQR